MSVFEYERRVLLRRSASALQNTAAEDTASSMQGLGTELQVIAWYSLIRLDGHASMYIGLDMFIFIHTFMLL